MRECEGSSRRYGKWNRNLRALCDLRLKGAVNHTDWIRADKDGTFAALVRRKCGREDPHFRFIAENQLRVRFAPLADMADMGDGSIIISQACQNTPAVSHIAP